MKEKKKISFFKACRRELTVSLLIIAVLWISFLLFDLPTDVLWYPVLLCIAIELLSLIILYRKKNNTVTLLKNIQHPEYYDMEELPKAENGVEEEYQRIIYSLKQMLTRQKEESDARFQDSKDYYSTWAHQIKVPIAALQLLLQEDQIPRGNIMRSELRRINQYADMVMTYMKLEDSSGDFVFEKLSLDGLIRDSIKTFAVDFIGKGISLDYHPTDREIVTDRKWLQFVLEQVISNAVKYTEKGTIDILVDDNLILHVRDTGIGISQSDIPRIFEKGYTGFNGRIGNSSSGIGLYLCKNICDRMNYAIDVCSEPGKGTEILIDLSRHQLLLK